MRIFWVDCVGGSFHLFSRCQKCENGIIWVTGSIHETGIIMGKCVECKGEQALFVRPAEKKIWCLAEPAEVVIPKG